MMAGAITKTKGVGDSAKNSSAGRPLLECLRLANLLSFGDSTLLELRPLNVLIGPNGSGKSNLIEAIALLRSSAKDLGFVLRQGGGVGEWIWKGAPDQPAAIEATIGNPATMQALWHRLEFAAVAQRFELLAEEVDLVDDSHPGFYRRSGGFAILRSGDVELTLETERSTGPMPRGTRRPSIDLNQSILSQIRGPLGSPEITYLADTYSSIRLYREWSFGRTAVFREPQGSDLPNHRLEEDFSNLGMFLNRMWRKPPTKRALLAGLQALYTKITDLNISVEGGTVQVFLEEGDYVIPATRLSDGTLRYICLLAALLDPEPPPLICIEEPELGLHPDIIPRLADLLVEASKRTQIIATTHSDILIDALSEHPESVIVCEKHEGQTRLERLDPEPLAEWLERYRLGELWTRGEIGGTRW